MEKNFQCIRCKEAYSSSEDEENYYCPTCLFEKKNLADKLDKQSMNNPKIKVKSELQIYDEIAEKTHGKFPNYKYFLH